MHEPLMRQALRLARRGYGNTSPNPMVGALLVRAGKVIGRGWHRRAGEAHADLLQVEQAPDLLVLGLIGACGIAPRVASALAGVDPEVGAHV